MTSSSNNKANRSGLCTRKLIKESLLELMKDRPFASISAADIARRAEVGRSTFYRHYENASAVLADAVDDSISEMKTLFDCLGFFATEHMGSLAVPFCQYVRKSTRYRSVYLDETAAGIVEERLMSESGQGFLTEMTAARSYSPEQVEAVALFSMTGYLSICRAYAETDDDTWRRILWAVDDFSRITACERAAMMSKREDGCNV